MKLITRTFLTGYDAGLDLPDERVDHLIEVASAEVIDAAGSPILRRTTTVELPSPVMNILHLPGKPIRSVHSVRTETGGIVGGWRRIHAGIYRPAGWPTGMLTINYDHGLDEVPADIKDLVARMVIAGGYALADQELALQNGRLSSVAIDDYKEGYNTTNVEALTEMQLPEGARTRLAARFGGGGPRVGTQL